MCGNQIIITIRAPAFVLVVLVQWVSIRTFAAAASVVATTTSERSRWKWQRCCFVNGQRQGNHKQSSTFVETKRIHSIAVSPLHHHHHHHHHDPAATAADNNRGSSSSSSSSSSSDNLQDLYRSVAQQDEEWYKEYVVETLGQEEALIPPLTTIMMNYRKNDTRLDTCGDQKQTEKGGRENEPAEKRPSLERGKMPKNVPTDASRGVQYAPTFVSKTVPNGPHLETAIPHVAYGNRRAFRRPTNGRHRRNTGSSPPCKLWMDQDAFETLLGHETKWRTRGWSQWMDANAFRNVLCMETNWRRQCYAEWLQIVNLLHSLVWETEERTNATYRRRRRRQPKRRRRRKCRPSTMYDTNKEVW